MNEQALEEAKERHQHLAREASVNHDGKILGAIVMLAGIGCLVYFALIFNPTASSGDGDVANLGLECTRIVGVICGAAVSVFGLLIIIAQVVINTIRIAAGKPV